MNQRVKEKSSNDIIIPCLTTLLPASKG